MCKEARHNYLHTMGQCNKTGFMTWVVKIMQNTLKNKDRWVKKSDNIVHIIEKSLNNKKSLC